MAISSSERRGGDTTVLDALRLTDADIAVLEVRRLELTVAWAVENECDPAEVSPDGWFGDRALALAGAGGPLVSEFAVVEYAAVRGMSAEAGQRYVADCLELRYRLPRLWERVLDGRVPAWRGRRIAERTLFLSADAAAHVDRHLAPFAHSCSWAQVDRLVDEAVARSDPALAEERRRAAADGRRFDVHLSEASIEGVVPVEGLLDVNDAVDLDAAVRAGAQRLADLGCSDPLDVRRAKAVGEIARGQLALDLGTCPSGGAEAGGGRGVVLHLHLSDAALYGGSNVARVERPGGTGLPVLAGAVREWLQAPGTRVVVKPVLDLAEHVDVTAYEAPDRVRDQVTERDPTCVFPDCSKPAKRCDLDHGIPHDRGGPTCGCNLAPLCRRHHRAKTHGRYDYVTLRPGTYLWTTPSGYRLLRDAAGTHPVIAPTHDP